MLKDLFLTPGRLLTRIFAKEKKRAYRSARNRPTESLATIILSVVCWLILAGCVLYSIDKAGFLKQALDVGVEVATSGEAEEPAPAPPNSQPLESTGSVTGSLNTNSPSSPPPAGVTGTGPGQNSRPGVETEMWLVILHSIPKIAGRGEAERRQSQYLSKGLRVDILDTDAFPRLLGGNWIVALGPFDSRAAAVAASTRAMPFNSGLMVRRGL